MRQWLVLIWTGLSLLGCSWHRPAPFPWPQAEHEPSLKELVSLLNKRHHHLKALKASFSLKTESLDGSNLPTVQGMLALERPYKMRVKAFKAFSFTLFDLLCQGERFHLLIPAQGRLYVGQGPFLAKLKEVEVVFDPKAIQEVFFVDELDLKSVSLEKKPKAYFLNIYDRSQGLLKERLWIDRSQWVVVRRDSFDSEGLLQRQILLGDYLFFDSQQSLPQKVTLKDFQEGFSFTLVLKEVQANAHLNPDLFAMALPQKDIVVEEVR